MQIKENECMSAVFKGINGAISWLQGAGSTAIEYFKLKLLNVKNMLKDAAKKIKNKLKGATEKIKQGWDFLTDWFQDDPVGAAAGVGLLAVGVGIAAAGGGFIGAVGGAGLAVAAKIGGASAAVAGLFGAKLLFSGDTLVEATSFAYNFDWNVSVEAIKEAQRTAARQVVLQLGDTAGRAIGGITCGAVAGLATVEINAKVLAKTWYLIKDDTREEIIDAFTDLALSTQRAAATMAFLESYKTIRDFARKKIRTNNPKINKIIESWGDGKKPWIFAEFVEEKIDSISDADTKAFVENLVEGLVDGCSSAVLAI